MQAIAVCFLIFVITGCGNAKTGNADVKPASSASITNDIIIKVTERDRDKDGKPDSRIENFFRDGQRVMVALGELNARGVWVVGSRAYHVGGKTVLIEGDDDGDGLFETLIVYRTDSDDFEVFTREANGSVHPASARVVQAHKKQEAAFNEFFEEMFDKNQTPTNLDGQIIEERIRATQKKVQDAQKEIDEGKQ